MTIPFTNTHNGLPIMVLLILLAAALWWWARVRAEADRELDDVYRLSRTRAEDLDRIKWQQHR